MPSGVPWSYVIDTSSAAVTRPVGRDWVVSVMHESYGLPCGRLLRLSVAQVNGR